MMPNTPSDHVALSQGAMLLPGFALEWAEMLLSGIAEVALRAPFRQMVTPGGFAMSVAMTNCGPLGWVTDRKGYRYSALDPVSGLPWPPMPEGFARLSSAAAIRAGYSDFSPDACLINRYDPKARMSRHQDRDERDLAQPIVSVSLGVSAVFEWGGIVRQDAVQRIPLHHGDVVVWGGPSRLIYHGIQPLKAQGHAQTGEYRYNLTFRRAD